MSLLKRIAQDLQQDEQFPSGSFFEEILNIGDVWAAWDMTQGDSPAMTTLIRAKSKNDLVKKARTLGINIQSDTMDKIENQDSLEIQFTDVGNPDRPEQLKILDALKTKGYYSINA